MVARVREGDTEHWLRLRDLGTLFNHSQDQAAGRVTVSSTGRRWGQGAMVGLATLSWVSWDKID